MADARSNAPLAVAVVAGAGATAYGSYTANNSVNLLAKNEGKVSFGRRGLEVEVDFDERRRRTAVLDRDHDIVPPPRSAKSPWRCC
jgi:hypothetical protein